MRNNCLSILLGLILSSLAGLPAQAGRPADLPSFAFIGLHGGVFDVIENAASSERVSVTYIADDELQHVEVDLAAFDAVLVQHLRKDLRRSMADAIFAARSRNSGMQVLALSRRVPALDGQHADSANIQSDTQLRAYYGTSRANLRRMLTYLRVKVAGRSGSIEPPVAAGALGVWHPDHEGLMDVAEFAAFTASRAGDYALRPRVAVAVHTIHLEFQQPAVVDALIRALEAQGLCAFAVIDAAEGLQALRPRYETLLAELQPDAVVHTCHSTDRLEQRLALDVPHLSSVFFRKQSIKQWMASDAGIASSEVVFQIATQELLGAIEPIAAAGTTIGGGHSESFIPIPERVNKLAARTRAWVELRQKSNADKRIAIVYQDAGMNKSGLMQGTATGMHLNAPRSMLTVLAKMKQAGYSIEGAPLDEASLIAQLLRSGRQIAQSDTAALRRLEVDGAPELLPVSTYKAWLEEHVPDSAKQQLLKRWGPPPGDIMTTVNAAGEPCFVIPRIDLGGVVLLPQPLRGEAHDSKSLHDKLTCPPHHYIATYLWLQRGLQADAVVHFGTHGSEFVLPGKSVGLGPDCWPSIVIGDMPNISPWIVENLGEAMASKRRSHAVLIGHLPPPAVDAGLHGTLLRVHDDLDRFATLPPGALKEVFRRSLSKAILEQHLDRDVGIEMSASTALRDEQLQSVDDYLHQIAEEVTPVSLHVFGQRPSDALLIPHIVSCLGQTFRERLATLGAGHGKPDHARTAAEEVLRAVLVDKASLEDALIANSLDLPDRKLPNRKLPNRDVPNRGLGALLSEDIERAQRLWRGYGKTHNEIEGLMAALAGRFVAPGPGRGPMRNPGALPTGRNLFALNPEEVPSRPSWELGKQLAEQLIADHVQENGSPPKKVAFALSSFATFQDFGVMESQILWLLGCEPIWDDRNLVREVRVLPRSELGRPRVDVFLSALSYYRDNLPSRMALLDRAVRSVAALDEADNPVAAGTRRIRARLLASGETAQRSEQLAAARIFGYAPGLASSADYYYLVERSTQWSTREDLVQTYLDATSYVYTEGAWGEQAESAHDAAMQDTSIVVRTLYDNTTSPLANKYSWYSGGSLALAIESVTGHRPAYVFNDVRDPNRARVVDSKDALRMDYRVRLFNRKWILGMLKEGYAGAGQMQVMVDNVFGWQTMREGSVDDDVWERIRQVYLEDSMNVGMREFFAANNPFAEQRLMARLLEAVRKDYWHPEQTVLEDVAQRYLASIDEHGDAGGFDAGKRVIATFASTLLPAAQPTEDTIAKSDNGAEPPGAAPPDSGVRSVEDMEASTQPVRGQRLEQVTQDSVRPWSRTTLVFLFSAVLCLLLGMARRPT